MPESATVPPPPRSAQRVSALLAVAVVGVSVAALAYFGFTRLDPHDDEGYVLVSLQQWLAGGPLYDLVQTQYGPGFYLVGGALFASPLFDLDHHGLRWISLLGIVATSLLTAAWVWRGTRSTLLSAATYAATALHLRWILSQPGHPQWLTTLLLAALLAALARDQAPRDRRALVACGALVGLSALTKINTGVFLLAGVALPFASATRGVAAARVTWACRLGLPLLPWALLGPSLGEPAFLGLALYASAALAAVAVVTPSAADPPLAVRDWRWPFLGAAGAAAVCLLAALITGTSPAGLLRGVVLQHLGGAELFSLPQGLAPASLPLAGLGLTAAIAWRLLAARESPAAAWVLWASRRVLLLLLVLSWGPDLLLTTPPWVWPVLVPADAERPWRCGRACLAGLAATTVLIVYPTRGTQTVLASALALPAAALVAHDAFASRFADAQRGWLRWATPLALVGMLAWLVPFASALQARYRGSTPLRAQGAEQVRLRDVNPTPQARRRLAPESALLNWLTANLRAHGDVLVTKPGLGSLHAFSGLPAPSPYNLTHWVVALPAAAQDRVVEALAASPRACVVTSEHLGAWWLRGRPEPRGPLVAYLDQAFRPVARIEGYTLRLRRERADPELRFSLLAVPGGLELRVPQLARPASRITLFHPSGALDTLGPLQVDVWAADGWRPHDLAAAPLEGPARLRLRPPAGWTLPPTPLYLRAALRAAAGDPLTTIPFVEPIPRDAPAGDEPR